MLAHTCVSHRPPVISSVIRQTCHRGPPFWNAHVQRAGHTVTLSPLTPQTFTQHSHILGVRESESPCQSQPRAGTRGKGLEPRREAEAAQRGWRRAPISVGRLLQGRRQARVAPEH